MSVFIIQFNRFLKFVESWQIEMKMLLQTVKDVNGPDIGVILKEVFTIIITLGVLNICSAQRCASPNITSSQFEYGYNFNEDLSLNTYGVIESFQMTGTERIFTTSNNNWLENYIDARFARGLLEVFTTANFRKYVEEQSSTRINLQVTLVCEDQSRPMLVFRINIKRENLYNPQFSQPVYNFAVPLPLYKGFDLTVLEKISARDVDIFDNKVTFSTDFSGIIEVKTNYEEEDDGKTFFAMLLLTQPLIILSSPIEFTITATDNGEPQKSGTALIRIEANKTLSLAPPPRFEKNIYTGYLNESLSLFIENIVLARDSWSSDVGFSLHDSDAYLFELGFRNNLVRVSLERPLVEEDIENRDYFSFTVLASRPDALQATCTVIVRITKKNSEHRFISPYYSGSLDKNGTLSTEIILYDVDDYSPDMDFALIGPDAELFQVSHNQTLIQLEFTGDIMDINYDNRRFLFVIVTAIRDDIEIANAGVAVILPISPKFMQRIYRGRIDKTGTLALEYIHFEDNIATEVKSVRIFGNFSERFTIRGSRTELNLELIEPFSEDELRTMKFVQLIIVAISRSDVEGSADILVEFPEYLPPPIFEKEIFKGRIDKDGSLSFGRIVLINKTYTDGIRFELEGDTKDFFDMNTTRNEVTLMLVKELPTLLLKNSNYLHLTVTARNLDDDKASTTILLEAPVFVAPEFTKIFYKGTSDRYFQLDIEDISITANTYEDGVVVALVGRDSKFFKIQMNTLNIVLEVNDENLNPDELSGRSSLDVALVAQNKVGLTGRTTIVVDLPVTCGSGNATCPPCVIPPNSMCPQTTTADPTKAPIFDRKLYLYRIYPNYVGTFGNVLAKIPESTDPVEYSLDVSNDHLTQRLSVNRASGEITAHSNVSPGLYTFRAVATNAETYSKGFAMIRLTVDAANECPNGTTVVSSTFLTKHIAEEKIHTDLLNSKYGRCFFSIFSMEPDDKEYLKIDPRTNQLMTIAIDREDPIFSSMVVPQILAHLKLNCPDTPSTRQRRSVISKLSMENDPRSLVLLDDIPFDPYRTTMTLIVEDINDHSPEFTHPPHGSYVIGFAETDVYYNIMPDYLIRVHATDDDSGLNAKIRYNINENDYFQIDQISGIIYPTITSSRPFKALELVVLATDRDGAHDGRKTRIKIMVKQLMSRHLITLKINNQASSNVDYIMGNLSLKLGSQVRYLRYAMLPGQSNESNASSESFERNLYKKTTMRAWIYAVDKEGQFWNGTDVEKKLNTFDDGYDMELSPYKTFTESEELALHAVGLVAGVSVLGTIMFGIIVSAILFWWFWLRPRKFKSISSETASETASSEGSINHDMKYKSDNNFYYEEGDAYEVGKQFRRKDTIPVSGATHLETSDDSNSQDDVSNQSVSSDDSREQNERRKSIVTFNELVERIDIETNDNRNPSSNNSNVVRF